MAVKKGYDEEDRLDKAQDFHLLKRLLPFLKPYRRLLIGSIFLVMVITILDLALPYFSKIAIDRFIMPATTTEVTTTDSEPSQRFFVFTIESPRMRSVVEKRTDLFHITGNTVRISYEDLRQLSASDLAVIRQTELDGLKFMVLIFLVLMVADFGLTFAQRMIMEYAGHKIMHDMRIRLFGHILDQSMAFFTRQPVARLVTRVTNDVQNMHELFTTFVSMVFKDIFILIGIATILLVLDWRVGIAGFAVLPIVVWAAVRFSIRARKIFRAMRVKVAEINTHINETIDGIKTIQAFVQEESNHQRFTDLNEENYRLGMKEIHIFSLFMPAIEMLGFFAVAIVLYYGGLHVIDAQITLGVLVAAITYIRMFFRPLRDLAENYNVLQNAMASAERLFILLDTNEQLPVAVSTERPELPERDILETIELDHVSFGYIPGELVVSDISFTVQRGETIALVGPTGAGKTSLLNLILRFYDPVEGRIRVNHLDLRQWRADQLRALVAMVPQDPLLFTGTLRENIFDTDNTMDPAAIDQVLDDANCRDLVDRQPQGLDTQLVKGGSGLSSGERQLITIARAFARNPQLILLDEATSYIDSHTEAVIHDALHNLTAGRTCILVAHRLSTARTADRIVVMQHGRVREIGPHDQLMAARGLYWRLHQQSTK